MASDRHQHAQGAALAAEPQQRLGGRGLRAYAAAGLSALAAAGLRAALLLDDPWAHGYDGWYYVLQVRSWLAGAPLFDDRSLVFPLLALLARLTGDVILGNKLAACLFGAITAGAGALAAWRWTGALSAAAVCGAWWALSPLHLCLSAEFLKNSGGLAVLAVLLAVLPGCERRRTTLAAAVGLLLLGPMFHKVTGVLGLLIAGGYAAVRATEGRLPPRALAVAAGLLLLAVALLGVLRPVDLARFVGEAASGSRFAALFQGSRLVLPEKIEVALVHLAPLGLLGVVGGRDQRALGAGLLLAALAAAAPGLPFGWELTAWRLLLMGFVPLGLLVAWGSARLPPARAAGVAALVVGGLLLSAPAGVVAGQRRSPDYAGWAEVVPVLQVAVPPGGRVVAHRGLCGFVWAEADIVCENFAPQGTAEGWWRIVYGFSLERLQAHTVPGEAAPLALRPGYQLVQEATWRRFVATEGQRFRLARDPRNPFEARPAYVYGPGRDTPEPEGEPR